MSDLTYYQATFSDSGIRLDTLLAQRLLFKSRSAAARAIEDKQVLVNGSPVQKKYQVEEFDSISFQLEPNDSFVLKPTNIDLDIRYEDEDIVVLSKQAGLVCHPSASHQEDTLVNALLYRYGVDGLCAVQGEDETRRGIVHRLDRDTSGLMLAAKTNEAGRRLIDQIGSRSVDRHYFALAHGIIEPDTGKIDAPIARNPADRTRMSVSDSTYSREAITTFNVIERYFPGKNDDGYTLLDCKLFTGRTHQIRVHMEYIKHPIVGDGKYSAHGPKSSDAQCGLTRQFLHSYRLCFIHPITGIKLRFVDRWPSCLDDVLQELAVRSTGRTNFGNNIMHEISNTLPGGKNG